MYRSTAVIGLLLAAGLAGCVSDPPATPDPGPKPWPPATLACLGTTCNFEATLTPATRQANELSIAVNPLDPLNIIATGKDYTPEEAGDCVWAGVYTTKDGGLTWKNQNVPGSNWKRMMDPNTPVTPFSKFWCVTDPVVAFGPDGTAYWAVMPYQCDRVSGSKTGRGVLPQGGFNDWFWTCSSMYVLTSSDGGLTWPTVAEVAIGPRLEHDKEWLSVAPNGKALLCWDRSDHVDDSGTPASQLTPQGDMLCSVSSDKGKTWTQPASVNPSWSGFLPWVDYDADSIAWMAAIDGTRVLVSRSTDGRTWGSPVAIGTYVNPPPGGQYGWPVLKGSEFRTFALPALAVDRSSGPYAGSVYVTWFDYSKGHGQVLFSFSRDGETFSTPVRIRDSAANAEHDQFMPVVSVGPDGTVDLTWYDRRMDAGNHLFDLFYAYSLDGGQNWSENLRVSEVSSDEQYSHHQNGMIFMGDYIDLDSSMGQAHAVWVDTRHSKADAFVATIARPSANLGMT
jgi:hypothetical protein